VYGAFTVSYVRPSSVAVPFSFLARGRISRYSSSAVFRETFSVRAARWCANESKFPGKITSLSVTGTFPETALTFRHFIIPISSLAKVAKDFETLERAYRRFSRDRISIRRLNRRPRQRCVGDFISAFDERSEGIGETAAR